DVTLSYASFSSALEITSAPSKPNYVLFFRLRGSSEYTVHRRVFTTSPLIGALLPGMQPARVLTNEDWHVFGTRFAPDTLQRELSQMLDRQILRPVEFDPMVRFDQGAGQIIRRMLGRLYEEAGNRDFRFTNSLAVWQLERLLISTVLEGHKHNYS